MMAENDRPHPSSHSSAGDTPSGGRDRAERSAVEELSWGLIEGTIGDRERERLEQLLAMSPAARQHYLDTMWLHSALQDHFAEEQLDRPVERGGAPGPGGLLPTFGKWFDGPPVTQH